MQHRQWLFAALVSVCAQAQTPSTSDNLIWTTQNPPPSGAVYNWSGFVGTDSTGGGYNGGSIAGYNSKNHTFYFGWTQSTVAYSMAVNSALSGTGIKVNGINYSYDWYNSDWNRGTLSATLALTGSQGKTLESYTWYHPPVIPAGWQTNTGTKTFTNPYELSTISNLSLSFTGKDDRYWAGYYGPKVTNIDVRLSYAVNSAPKGDTEGQKPQDKNCVAMANSKVGCNTVPAADSVSIPTSTAAPSDTTVPVVELSTAALSSTAPKSSSTVSENSQTPMSNVTSHREQRLTRDSVSIGLATISRNQQRESRLAEQAVQNAVSSAAASAADADREALAVAAVASAASATSQVNQTVPMLGQGLRIAIPITVVSANQSQSNVSSQIAITPSVTVAIQNNSNTTTETVSAMVSNALLDRTNPLNEYFDPKSLISPVLPGAGGPSVNQNAADNAAAGNTNIGKMAVAPVGFTDYVNFSLKDASFYAPKEVYRNQRNIDNARALRQLSSDRVHQRMVEQQYRTQQ